MVPVLEGRLEYCAHTWSILCNSICLIVYTEQQSKILYSFSNKDNLAIESAQATEKYEKTIFHVRTVPSKISKMLVKCQNVH